MRKKAIWVSFALFSLLFSFLPLFSQGAVIYDSSNIGTPYLMTSPNLAENFYVRLPFSQGEYMFSEEFSFKLPSDIAFLRVKKISGVPCHEFRNVNLFDDKGDLIGTMDRLRAVAVGDFCDLPFLNAEAGRNFSAIAFCVHGGCDDRGGELVLDGSPTNAGFTFNGYTDRSVTGGFAFQLCDIDGCSGGFEEVETEGPNPVLIIPGIAGTELYDEGDLIWPNIGRMFTNINDQFLSESLMLDDNGNSINSIQPGEAIEDTVFTIPIVNKEIKISDYFRSLLIDLESGGYERDISYSLFPYDWRLNLTSAVFDLKQKIDDIKNQTGSEKIDIVAHSMGGLVAKAYVHEYGDGNIGKLIFVGTPHLGAPKAGKVLLTGDQFSIPWLEKERIKEIAENSPALHQLLPSHKYFDQFQGYIRKYSDENLRDYEGTKSFFLDEKDKNINMFNLFEDFQNKNLQDINFSDAEVYNIAGCTTPTQSAYRLGTLGTIVKVGYSSGDGTVPLISSDYINISEENKFYVKNGDHPELSSQDGVRDLILSILTDESTETLSDNVSQDSGFCNFKGKILTWHSPVEVHIYDSEGRHTGPIENGGIEYGIPGVDYEIIDHNKFIFIPTDGDQSYRVEAIGTDDGTFDLLISESENGSVLETMVFNDIPVNTSTQIKFEISNTSEDSTIEVKEGENQSIFIETVVILDDSESEDVIPPDTQIGLVGKEYKDGEFKKEVEVSFNATDDNSGVLETKYSLDGQNFSQYMGTFTLGTEGIYNIHYYSIDRAGNNENIKKMEVVIGKLSKVLRKIEN